jgi:hypothetical protein
VGSGTEQAILQVLTKAIVNGECDDEGSNSGSDSKDGNSRDDANESLAALGAQVSGSDEEFKSHGRAFSRQLSAFSQIGL